MTINNDLENLCSVKKDDFNKIFSNFFSTEDITTKLKCDESKLYSNYEIHKIHLRNPENINELLHYIFEHIITFSGENFNKYTDIKSKYKESISYLKKYFDASDNELENLSKEDLDNKKFQWKVSWLKEVWEIILYFLLEWFLESPIAISKIPTKTSNKMPIFWADWIHISSDYSKLLFWEAKLNNKLSYWKEQSRESIEWFIKTKWKVFFELKVITSQLGNLPKNKENIIWNLINPYYENEEKIKSLPYEITCLLWYEDEDYKLFVENKDKDIYEQKLFKKIEWLLSYYNLKNKELEDKKIIFFLLPFIDILDFLKKYWLKLRDKKNL